MTEARATSAVEDRAIPGAVPANPRGVLVQAVRDTAPFLAGMTPFALAFGAVAVARGLPGTAVVGMSAAVYAGLAQLTVVNLYGSGTDQLVLLLAFVALINLRFSLMGLSLLPHTRSQPAWVRAGLAFGLSDEPYAVVIHRFSTRGYDLAYQCCVFLIVYLAWVAGTALGVALAGVMRDPLAWGIDFAAVAAFIVLLAPRLRSSAAVVTATASAGLALLARRSGLGEGSLLAASLAGLALGAGWRVWKARRASNRRDEVQL